ncbi:C1 family peptidase [Bacteriovorax sp. BAL6_X]|uniref:C1 family peptidase n=1 Tax=Bacteriovorax sp. BAL6_X TaxID=1201290 RepID=UPI0018DE5F99|nr:C1 family peptidase [Bacteriovorax sp. BAL6_X]
MQSSVCNLVKASGHVIPSTLDLRSIQSSVKNQGNRGACTFFSATSLLESEIIKQQNIEINISEQFMIYTTKNYDGYGALEEGSSVIRNLYAAKKYGITFEQDLPYQQSWFSPGMPCSEDSAGTSSGYECYHHNSSVDKNRIISLGNNLEIIDIDDNINQRSDLIISYLSKNKRPVSVNIVINDDIMLSSKNGDIKYNSKLRDECNTYSMCFAHSIVITGYNLKDKTFKFKNSYGNSWGSNGYGTIAFEYINKLYGAPQIMAVELKKKWKLIKPKLPVTISPKVSVKSDIDFDGRDINVKVNGRVEYLPKSQFKIQFSVVRIADAGEPKIVSLDNNFINLYQYATTDDFGILVLDEIKKVSFKNVRHKLTKLNEELYLFTLINKVSDREDENLDYTFSKLTFPAYVETFKDCSEASKTGLNPDKQQCFDKFKGSYTLQECLSHATGFDIIYMDKIASCFKELKGQSNFGQCSSFIRSIPESMDKYTQLENCKDIYEGEYTIYECNHSARLISDAYYREKQLTRCELGF